MSAFGLEGFASVEAVEVELYTAAYRITGTVHTPFRRVADGVGVCDAVGVLDGVGV